MSENATRSDFEVIAHRCLGFGFRENTVQAMQAAISSPVRMIEFDVRLTKDRKWVVIHNPFLKTEKQIVFQVHEHTYSKLKREVTLLGHMLALFAAHGEGKELMIDVKDVGEERQLVRLIQQSDVQERVIVIAWEPEVLRRVHKLEPSIRLGLSYVPIHSALKLVKGTMPERVSRHHIVMKFNTEQRFDMKKRVGFTNQHYLSSLPDLPLYSIQVYHRFCSSKLVKLAHTKGWKVYPFVVNTRLEGALLKRRGVDGLLSDEVKLFLKDKK